VDVHRDARRSPVAQVFNLWMFIATLGAAHAPSPDAHCGHATVAPSPPSRRRLRLTVAGRGPAPSILPFARSMLPPLRRAPIRCRRIGRGCASEATPAPGARAGPRSLVAVRQWQKANVSSGCHTQWHRFMRRRPEWPAHRQAATVRTALQHYAPPARTAGSPTGCNGHDGVAAVKRRARDSNPQPISRHLISSQTASRSLTLRGRV
jgi:hypothetical protein